MTFARRHAALLLAAVLGACTGGNDDAALVAAGERIYREGVLPDGSALVARRPEGLVLEGRFASCGTCHRKSGMGSIEGLIDSSILVPPIAGPVLFRPARFAESLLDDRHHYVPHDSWRRAMTRPAYDEASLAATLRDGLNTAGEPIGAPMPLYDLDRESMNALAAYLRVLGAESDPGVTDTELHIATIVTPGAPDAHVDAVLDVLRAWAATAQGSGHAWRLHEWRLEGSANDWGSQLQKHYDRQPVFAVLSGVGASEWRPVHAFCERTQVPCVFPAVDVAPVDRDTRFSVYLSPGVALEAAILARHLQDEGLLAQRLVQVHDDKSGERAGGELVSATSGSSQTIHWLELESIGAEQAIASLRTDDVVMFWLRPESLAKLVNAAPHGLPSRRVYLSALLANPEAIDLPPAWREQVRFVTLFDDLGMQSEIAKLRLNRWLERHGIGSKTDRRLQADAYVAAYLFNESLAAIRRQELRRPAVPLTREHLLETLEDLVAKYSDGTQLIDEDLHVAYYGRMSLGPGQRVAARGGSIARYASPDSARLVIEGERIVP